MKTSPRLIIAVVGLVFLVQWLVPLRMISGREHILKEGTVIKLRVRPVDPYDPFRGRYIRFRLDPPMASTVTWPGALNGGEKLFVSFQVDASGFGKVTAVGRTEPDQPLYLVARIFGPNLRSLQFDPDRYYMNEALAPQAEILVAEKLGENAEVWAEVSVYQGDGILTGILVDGVPIEALVRQIQTAP